MSQDSLSGSAMTVRFVAGLAVVLVTGWVNLMLVDRWLSVVGTDIHRMELGGVVVWLGVLGVQVVGIGVWASMWRLRGASDGARRARLLLGSIALVLGLGFVATAVGGALFH